MSIRDVSFDGRKVSIKYVDEEVAELLEFLFLDLDSDDSLDSQHFGVAYGQPALSQRRDDDIEPLPIAALTQYGGHIIFGQ